MSTQDAYREKFEAKLKEANAEIDKLAAKAQGAQADAKLQMQDHLNALRARRDALSEKLSKFRDSSGDAAKDLQAGAENAWNELATSLKSAQAKFH